MKEPITGGCLCGRVRYESSGAPYNVTHCHCLDCRRSSGAAFVTWASFRRDEFRIVQGAAREMTWEGRIRGFCADCGTPLIFLADAASDEIDVTVCSLDRPEALAPSDHIWVEDRLPWIRLNDGLPIHKQKRDSGDFNT